MLEGLLKTENGYQILPFVRCFFGSPSTYSWEDEMGMTQNIQHGREGSKVIPSCQCCRIRSAPGSSSNSGELLVNERVFAHLDDMHAVCRHERWGSVRHLAAGAPEPCGNPVTPRENTGLESGWCGSFGH